MGDITRLLALQRDGDPAAERELFDRVYGELKRIAQREIHGGANTLSPTAVVHEAYLRMQMQQGFAPADRRSFFAFSAKLIRDVLCDAARARQAQKRGGDWKQITLTGLEDAGGDAVDVLAVDQALTALAELDPRQAQIVDLRFFGGLEMIEIAEHLQLSRATVQRDWEAARIALFALLGNAAHGA